MITLTLPYPPSKNHLHRRVGRLTLLSREAREYRENVCECVVPQLAGRRWPMTGPVKVTLRFYRPRKTGDVDGRIPWTLDCLQGIAFVNDSQVVEIHAYREEDKLRPRVEVTVEQRQ